MGRGAVAGSMAGATGAEEGASSLAQRARPKPSVENVTSAPAPQKREFNADSSSSDGTESVAAASVTFATVTEAVLSLALARLGQSLWQSEWCPWQQRHLDHLGDHASPAAGLGRLGSLARGA
eukprot:1502924-Pleurochrysis_carterae.AAC.2